MKRKTVSLWILLSLWALAVTLVGGVWWIIAAQSAAATELAERVKATERAVVDEDWSEAARTIEQVLKTWERTRRVWSFYTEHREMDEISDLLIEAEALIAAQQRVALVPLRKARDRIVTLPQRDRLDLENLF